MEGPGDIPSSLARAAGRLSRERQAVTPSPGVYRTLMRTFCFFVQVREDRHLITYCMFIGTVLCTKSTPVNFGLKQKSLTDEEGITHTHIV